MRMQRELLPHGVHRLPFHPPDRRYLAALKVGGRTRFLGMHATLKAAQTAVQIHNLNDSQTKSAPL
jgi:hypothetical protein